MLPRVRFDIGEGRKHFNQITKRRSEQLLHCRNLLHDNSWLTAAVEIIWEMNKDDEPDRHL